MRNILGNTMETLPSRKASLDSRKSKISVDQRSAGDNSPIQGRRRPSQTSTIESRDKDKEKAPRSPVHKREPKPTKQAHLQPSEAVGPDDEANSNGSISPRSPRSKAASDRGKTTPTLPPYLRATIAEQLAPVCTRPARENTQETIFGAAESTAEVRKDVKSREDTQMTLFGEPEPLTIKKSTRRLADTQNNLFGPPPQFSRRQSPRFPADTLDILRHGDKRSDPEADTHLQAVVGRYILRHQDTHEKLFGAPMPLRSPQPQKPMSNVFWADSKSSPKDKVVKSLPMSSLIADE